MENIAITVENVSISYRELKKMSLKTLIKKARFRSVNKFEAVKNVSFEIPTGRILGIVGKNGSGKSTLLRAIAGIFSPDSGKIDTHGNAVSLLAIGVGFQKKLTGRENIYLSGLLLGFTKREIDEKIDDIIEFSELGRFIDKPVKTYSSGMHSKLAFAITANLETDIMLIDEVLSVGDARFKKKSYAKMKSLIRNKNRTVVIVSHNTETLRKLCTDILWIHEGEMKEIGPCDTVLPKYIEFMQ